MRLLRMVLRGFKSFAQPTEIEFADGVTGIVGPNGAGKSNIADAVRWVLGEQSIRQLRGEKAADVIFAGTEDMRPKGAAEVTLVFDNPHELLLPDVAEVAVTRRLLRSGDSEYMINRRACRLKDIHLLFADTGLGKDSMAVIGQNRVDRILIGKPEERKAIFEEVAGITRYRMRKQDGLRKLHAAEQNMQRVQDVVQVYADRLEPLSARAETARRYHLWKQREQAALTTLAWQRWQNAQRKLTRAENECIHAEQALTAARTAVVAAQAERERRLAAEETEARQQRELEQARTMTQTRQERAKGEWQVAQERLERHAEEEKQATESLQAIETELAAGRAAIAETDARLSEVEKQYAAAVAAAQEAVQIAAQAEAAMQAYRQRCAAQEAAARDARQSIAERQAQAAATAKEIELMRDRARQEDARAAQYDDTLHGLQAALEEAIRTITEMHERLNAARHAAQAAKQRYEDCRSLRAQRQEEALRHRQAVQQHQERIRYLEHLANEYEGFGRATKMILQANAPWRDDCIGTVADILTVPAAYTTALDIALGARLQHLVVPEGATARAAIRYLQQRGGGRTTFYPLADIRGRELRPYEQAALREAGVCGSAAQCVTYDSAYDALVMYLLGGTMIVDTMETAQRLVTKYERRLRMVTLDGQLFQPGGSVTGGSTRQAELTVFGRRRELQSLQEELAALQAAPAIDIPSLESITAALAEAEETVRELTTAAVQAESRRAAAMAECRRVQELADAARADSAAARQRADTLAQACREESLLPQEEEVPSEAAPYTDDELAAYRQETTNRQVRCAKLEGDVARARENAAALAKREQELAARRHSHRERLAALAAETERLQARGQVCEEAFREATRAATAAAQAADAYYAEHGERRAAEQAANAAYDTLREAERDAQSAAELSRAKVTAARTETDERAAAFAATGYTADTIDSVRVEGTTPEIERTVVQAQREIAALGDVNPQAEEEYREAREQHSFYETQLADLAKARHGLQEVIDTIDREMERRFTEAFATVGTEFQRIFTHLFGGGEARLELVANEDDPVGGVEICIRPPGKKRQSLALLSGGERALSVIALLFAFQAVRPAPFCLVDEVDAALDDANVERFGRYLQSGRNDTQFIVITHRKQTMQAADRLVGVTMAQKGVSTLIAVDLANKEEHNELFG